MPDGLALLVGVLAGTGTLFAREVIGRRTIDLVLVALATVTVILFATDLASIWVVACVAAVVVGKQRRLVNELVPEVVGSALMVVALPDGSPVWFVFLAGIGAVLAGVAIREAGAAIDPFPVLGLVVVSAAGIYAAAPDTEQITAIGAVLGLVLIGAVVRRWDMTAHALAGILLVWAASGGSVGRPAALIGCLGCLGVLWFIAPVRAWSRVQPGAGTAWMGIMFATHTAVMLLASRWVGLQHSPQSAVIRLVPLMLGCAIVVVLTDVFVVSKGRPARR